MNPFRSTLLATAILGCTAPALGNDQLIKLLETQASPLADQALARVSMAEQAGYLAGLSATPLESVVLTQAEFFSHAFGAQYQPGASGLMAFESAPNTVIGSTSGGTVGSVEIEDLQLWAVDLTSHPAGEGLPAGAFELYSFTAELPGAGTYIGLMSSADPKAFGYKGQSTGMVNSFFVHSVLDTTLVDPLLAGAFVAQALDGGIDDYLSIAGWIEAITASDRSSDEGDGDGGSFMAGNGHNECAKEVIKQMRERLEDAWRDFRSAARPHEQTLGYGTAWDEIAIGYASGSTGYLGGPIVGSITACTGALVGLVNHLVNAPSDEEVQEAKELLEHEYKKFKEKRCEIIHDTRDALRECYDLPAGTDYLDDWVAKHGC